MSNKSMTIKVPGKLMIAGEFAVLEPYQKLAVMAVDRFVYAQIQASDINSLTLENFNINTGWDFDGTSVSIASENPRDRKSTRLNSSHVSISYAVFCLKTKRREDAHDTSL